MYKLPYLYLFKLHVGNISSALDPLLGKKDHVLWAIPTKEEPIVHWEPPVSARQTADQKSQLSGYRKSFKPNVDLENGVSTFPWGYLRQEW